MGSMCHTKPCMILYYDLSSQATLDAINSYISLHQYNANISMHENTPISLQNVSTGVD